MFTTRTPSGPQKKTVPMRLRKFFSPLRLLSGDHLQWGLNKAIHEVYILEGSFAANRSEEMRAALATPAIKTAIATYRENKDKAAALELFYSICRSLPKTLLSLSPASTARISALPKNKKSEKPKLTRDIKSQIFSGITDFMIEMLVADEIAHLKEYALLKQSLTRETLFDLLGAIERIHPILAWDRPSLKKRKPLRRAVEEYIKRRVQWELLAPQNVYHSRYVPVDSYYYQCIVTSTVFRRPLPFYDLLRDRNNPSLDFGMHVNDDSEASSYLSSESSDSKSEVKSSLLKPNPVLKEESPRLPGLLNLAKLSLSAQLGAEALPTVRRGSICRIHHDYVTNAVMPTHRTMTILKSWTIAGIKNCFRSKKNEYRPNQIMDSSLLGLTDKISFISHNSTESSMNHSPAVSPQRTPRMDPRECGNTSSMMIKKMKQALPQTPLTLTAEEKEISHLRLKLSIDADAPVPPLSLEGQRYSPSQLVRIKYGDRFGHLPHQHSVADANFPANNPLIISLDPVVQIDHEVDDLSVNSRRINSA